MSNAATNMTCMNGCDSQSILYEKTASLDIQSLSILPVMVPCTTVPFFNSIVTVSWLNFIKNLQRYKETKHCELPRHLDHKIHANNN